MDWGGDRGTRAGLPVPRHQPHDVPHAPPHVHRPSLNRPLANSWAESRETEFGLIDPGELSL